MIGALVLIISAAVLITGCSQPNSNKSIDISKKGIIEFDPASVKCQKTNSFPYTDIPTGSPIKEEDLLRFEAILPTNEGVECWYINDVRQGYEHGIEMFYTVKSSDIVGGKLKISVVSNALQGTVEFDSASVKCKKVKSFGSYTDVPTGSPIKKGDFLIFEAILPTNKVVEHWYINDVKQESQTYERMHYTVEVSDIVDGGGKLKISVVFKDAVQETVEFDSASVKCKKYQIGSSSTDITTGSPIQKEDYLEFEAILPAGKIVENWYINDVKQESKTDAKMSYTVKSSDIVGGKLKISVVFKDAVQGTVEFDVASIRCQKRNSFQYTYITTGSPIQEKDELTFSAGLHYGEKVENWYINDVKQKYETYSSMEYTVKAADIVGGKLKIRVVIK